MCVTTAHSLVETIHQHLNTAYKSTGWHSVYCTFLPCKWLSSIFADPPASYFCFCYNSPSYAEVRRHRTGGSRNFIRDMLEPMPVHIRLLQGADPLSTSSDPGLANFEKSGYGNTKSRSAASPFLVSRRLDPSPKISCSFRKPTDSPQ
jgi:hypothetical protein